MSLQGEVRRDMADGTVSANTASMLCDALDKAEVDRGALNVELQAEREAHGAAIARAQQAEVAIQRVRALAADYEQDGFPVLSFNILNALEAVDCE